MTTLPNQEGMDAAAIAFGWKGGQVPTRMDFDVAANPILTNTAGCWLRLPLLYCVGP